MKSLPSLEDRQTFPADATPDPSEQAKDLRDPIKAALLSLVPGLGQLYNGETGKGYLFLAVTAANAALLLLLVFSQPVLHAVGQLAAKANVQFNWDLVRSPELSQAAAAVAVIYVALVLSFIAYAMREAYDHAVRSRQGTVFARFFLGLPEATSGSYLLHFVVAAFCISMVFFVAVPKPPTEQVTLIEFTAPPPPPPPPAPEKPKPLPKREAPREVVQPKPKETPPPPPTQVAVATPTNEPVPLVTGPVEAPAQEAPSAPAESGPAGGGNEPSAGGGDPGEVDFGAYLAEMQKRIKKAWFPPKGNESKRISLKFKISKSGDVSRIRLVESSGLQIADAAAITAVESAAPFPPLPAGAPDQIEIKFTFDYNVFNGGQAALRN